MEMEELKLFIYTSLMFGPIADSQPLAAKTAHMSRAEKYQYLQQALISAIFSDSAEPQKLRRS